MGYKLIEGCCGSAALSFHLSGIKKPLLSYQGSKWRFRRQIEEIINSAGFVGKPENIELYDPGPWHKVIPFLKTHQESVIQKLKKYLESDPKVIYQQLQGQSISIDPAQFAADFLFLQRLSFSGKAVGCSSGRWNSPGFNSACAYGLEGTDKFGEVKPMIPSLIRILESIDLQLIPPLISGTALPQPIGDQSQTVLYLDPPYRLSTKYPDGDLTREELVREAKEWADAGALVLISEAEVIQELPDWKVACLSGSKAIESKFKSKKEEWITVNR